MKKLILTDDDFYSLYNGSYDGRAIRGGKRRLFEAELVIKLNRDGSYEVIKDRYGLSKEQIELEINQPDERLLLMLG
jgi:hypothetical protein